MFEFKFSGDDIEDVQTKGSSKTDVNPDRSAAMDDQAFTADDESLQENVEVKKWDVSELVSP